MSDAREKYEDWSMTYGNSNADNYVNELENEKEKLIKCLAWEMKAMKKSMGIKNVKSTTACLLLEQITGKPIEEIIKDYE